MNRWVEHYLELYSQENGGAGRRVAPFNLQNKECLPVMEELDALPTKDELSKDIGSLAYGKAHGSDLLKICKTTLLQTLYELLC